MPALAPPEIQMDPEYQQRLEAELKVRSLAFLITTFFKRNLIMFNVHRMPTTCPFQMMTKICKEFAMSTLNKICVT